MRLLGLVLCETDRQEAQKSYMANVAWVALLYASHGKCDFPKYDDIFGKKPKEEEETAEEIKLKILRDMGR